jgi:hypothetical protein
VDRLELVELIEAQHSKLSPQACELWDAFDALVYLSDTERKTLFTRQANDVMRRIGKLPRSDKRILNPLRELRIGLYASDHAERRGEPGECQRLESVITAARSLDREEGRQADSYTTVEQAVARLEEAS